MRRYSGTKNSGKIRKQIMPHDTWKLEENNVNNKHKNNTRVDCVKLKRKGHLS